MQIKTPKQPFTLAGFPLSEMYPKRVKKTHSSSSSSSSSYTMQASTANNAKATKASQNSTSQQPQDDNVREVSTKPPTQFPDYLLDHVFIHLPLTDLNRCKRVCQSWKATIEHYSCFKPNLFQAPPKAQTSSSRDDKPTTYSVHPAFSEVELDWSIVLSEAVFSRSKSKRPMMLKDYKVSKDMATFPALQDVEIEIVFVKLARNEQVQNGTGNNAEDHIVEEKLFKLSLVREGGVTVGDVWEGLLRLTSKKDSSSGETHREIFMKGDYHTFTWAFRPTYQPEHSNDHTLSDSSPPAIHQATLFGSSYRGFYDAELAAEKEAAAEEQKQAAMLSSLHTALTKRRKKQPSTQLHSESSSDETVEVKPEIEKEKDDNGISDDLAGGLPYESEEEEKQVLCSSARRRLLMRGQARKYDGEFDGLSF